MKNLKQLIKDRQYAEAKSIIIQASINQEMIEEVADKLLAVIDELQIKAEVKDSFETMHERIRFDIHKSLSEPTGKILDDLAKIPVKKHTREPLIDNEIQGINR